MVVCRFQNCGIVIDCIILHYSSRAYTEVIRHTLQRVRNDVLSYVYRHVRTVNTVIITKSRLNAAMTETREALRLFLSGSTNYEHKMANKMDLIATGRTRMISFSPQSKRISLLIADLSRVTVTSIGANTVVIRFIRYMMLGTTMVESWIDD